jgi:hypothetical protein
VLDVAAGFTSAGEKGGLQDRSAADAYELRLDAGKKVVVGWRNECCPREAFIARMPIGHILELASGACSKWKMHSHVDAQETEGKPVRLLHEEFTQLSAR